MRFIGADHTSGGQRTFSRGDFSSALLWLGPGNYRLTHTLGVCSLGVQAWLNRGFEGRGGLS